MSTTPAPHIEIRLATFPQDGAAVRALLTGYREYLATFVPAAHLCCDLPASELDHLPGQHAAPLGAFALALVDALPAGCAAIRPITVAPGKEAAELRRMWVPPQFRGLSLGRHLAETLIKHATAAGHTALYLDTFPAHMPAAQPLYRSLGFLPIPQYGTHAGEGLAYMRLELPAKVT